MLEGCYVVNHTGNAPASHQCSLSCQHCVLCAVCCKVLAHALHVVLSLKAALDMLSGLSYLLAGLVGYISGIFTFIFMCRKLYGSPSAPLHASHCTQHVTSQPHKKGVLLVIVGLCVV